MKVLIYQMDVIAGEPEANRKQVRDWLQNVAAEKNPDIVVLPELWTTGYALPKLNEIADADGENTDTITELKELAKQYEIEFVAGSIAVKTGTGIVNRAVTISKDGELKHMYDKIHLVPMLDEPLYLRGGDAKVSTFKLADTMMGSVICYDLRFPEVMRSLAVAGAKLIYVFGEWPAARRDHWDALLKARAIENQCYIVAANTVGSHNDVPYAGHSTVISPWGNVLAVADPEEVETLSVEIDLTEVDKARSAVPVFENRLPSLYDYL